MVLSIWQIYYDKKSYNLLDKSFIPYDNTGKLTVFFENEVIIDLWKNHRDSWVNSDYVGVLSWRLFEKTELTYDIIDETINGDVDKKDVYNLSPQMFDTYPSHFSEKGWSKVKNICKIIDKYELFPFKTYGFDAGDGFKNFCNYYLCKPEIFDDFVGNYLVKLYEWLQECKDPELLTILKKSVKYRKGLYTIHPFVLEGLFECYINYKGYTHLMIRNKK